MPYCGLHMASYAMPMAMLEARREESALFLRSRVGAAILAVLPFLY